MIAEKIYKDLAVLLQKYDSLTPMEGFKDRENISGHFEDLAEEIAKGLDHLFIQSFKEDFFWYDCPLQVYKNTFKNRLAYLNENDNPSLTLDELLVYDYRIFDVIPLFGQRTLRTDKKELNRFQSLDYERILNRDFVSGIKQKFVLAIWEKLELDRKKKMSFIQDQFKKKGKWIIKSGYDFEVVDLPTAIKIVEVAEPFNNIFANHGHKLFNHLLENSVSDGIGRKSDIAYFYRRMYADEAHYITARPEPFKIWFMENHDYEDLGKLKTLSQVENITRKKEYSRAIEWLKSQ